MEQVVDDSTRAAATAYVLQRYHLTDLAEAQRELTPSQFEGVQREIDGVAAQIVAQRTAQTAAPRARPTGISTPIGFVTPATGALLAAIWIVFALESLQPGGSTDTNVLYTFGAVTSDTLSSHQYWRLVADCFVHIGIYHIITNSIALIWIGTVAERLYGPLRYLGIYLAAGVGGSLVAVLTSPPQNISAGASGAIMGLIGAMLIGSWRNRAVIGAAAGRQLFSGLIVILVINLVFGFTTPGISNAAHIGGAVTGAVLALLIPYRSTGEPRAYTTASNALSVALIVAAIVIAATYTTAH
jgi:rhomboid protease GluP